MSDRQIRFTDRQWIIVCAAADRATDRDNFLVELCDALGRFSRPITDVDVSAVIAELSDTRTSRTKMRFNDSMEVDMKTFDLSNEDDVRELDARATRGEFIRSGERLKIPMSMADAKAVVESYRADTKRDTNNLTDGAGQSGISLHRPGFRQLAVQDTDVADARRRLVDEYRAYEAELTSAWKKDADPDHDDKTGKGGPVVRDASHGDGMTRDEAYTQYDRELEQAYRNPSE